MALRAFIERVDPFFGGPDCVRDETGRPVIYMTYLEGIRSLAESIVESLTVRLEDAKKAADLGQKTNLYEDVCNGGPISGYYICEVKVLDDGSVVDADENVYWPRAPM